MTLHDIIHVLDQLNEFDTIYAKEPWRVDSLAIVFSEPDCGGLPPEAQALDLSYFIEVAIAREFLEDWVSSSSGSVSTKEKCERLIQYAINDA